MRPGDHSPDGAAAHAGSLQQAASCAARGGPRGRALVIGLLLTVAAFAIAGRRLWWLYRLARTGQPAPERVAPSAGTHGRDARPRRPRSSASASCSSGRCRAWPTRSTFWGFLVLRLTIVEAYGALVSRTFAIPVIGHWPVIGFVEDLFAVAVLVASSSSRHPGAPQPPAARAASRASSARTPAPRGSCCFMIFNVIWTLLLYRGAQINTGDFPYSSGGRSPRSGWRTGLRRWGPAPTACSRPSAPAQLAVILGFLVLVVYSKHLHIFLAPFNVLFSRRPDGLGPLLPMAATAGCIDFEDRTRTTTSSAAARSRTSPGRACWTSRTCTECGRCQSQCPAWNTDKPLSPKLVDHGSARPRVRQGALPARGRRRGNGRSSPTVKAEAERPLVRRPLLARRRHRPRRALVLHDVRRLRPAVPGRHRARRPHRRHAALPGADRVVVPSGAAGLFKNLENKGNPWGMNASARRTGSPSWTSRCRSSTAKIPDDVEYLFWVGCAGALEDRAQARPPRRSPSCCTSRA